MNATTHYDREVVLKAYHYRRKKIVAFEIEEKHQDLIKLLKSNFNLRYNRGHNCYYITDTPHNLKQIFRTFNKMAWVNSEKYRASRLVKERPGQYRLDNLELIPESVKLLRQFSKYLEQLNYSENTVKSYTSMLHTFLSYFSHKNPVSLNEQDVIDFFTYYINPEGFSHAYTRQLNSALKLFFRFCGKMEFNPENISGSISKAMGSKLLSLFEVRQLMSSMADLRYKGIVTLTYCYGLRIGELLRLKKIDFDSKSNSVRVKNCDTAQFLKIPLDEATAYLIGKIMNKYQSNEYLLAADSGDFFSPSQINAALRRSADYCGIKKQVDFHSLRRSLWRKLLAEGISCEQIQCIMERKNFEKNFETQELFKPLHNIGALLFEEEFC